MDVWRVLKGQIEGLCGDFDDDDENDFRTPEGIIETDLSVFVNSWRNEKWENRYTRFIAKYRNGQGFLNSLSKSEYMLWKKTLYG